MHVIIARNVNQAYKQGALLLQQQGVRRASRNGEVIVVPHPVSTLYQRPRERVLYDMYRDANPFLHLYDALWCLAGRNDVAWLAQFTPRMADYSDNSHDFHGAYGYRWRTAQGVDQLHEIIKLLRDDPTTRRAVLQMWDASADLASPSKDLPCNLMVHFQYDEGCLNMTVFNRSNDMIWGAYGTNVVQFSILQEYLAAACGWDVGWYEQMSANFHAYVPIFHKHFDHGYVEPYFTDPYVTGVVAPYRLVHDVGMFEADLKVFVTWASPDAPIDFFESEFVYANPFFYDVGVPLLRAWRAYKRRAFSEAFQYVSECRASDWSMAAQLWLGRRST